MASEELEHKRPNISTTHGGEENPTAAQDFLTHGSLSSDNDAHPHAVADTSKENIASPITTTEIGDSGTTAFNYYSTLGNASVLTISQSPDHEINVKDLSQSSTDAALVSNTTMEIAPSTSDDIDAKLHCISPETTTTKIGVQSNNDNGSSTKEESVENSSGDADLGSNTQTISNDVLESIPDSVISLASNLITPNVFSELTPSTPENNKIDDTDLGELNDNNRDCVANVMETVAAIAAAVVDMPITPAHHYRADTSLIDPEVDKVEEMDITIQRVDIKRVNIDQTQDSQFVQNITFLTEEDPSLSKCDDDSNHLPMIESFNGLNNVENKSGGLPLTDLVATEKITVAPISFSAEIEDGNFDVTAKELLVPKDSANGIKIEIFDNTTSSAAVDTTKEVNTETCASVIICEIQSDDNKDSKHISRDITYSEKCTDDNSKDLVKIKIANKKCDENMTKNDEHETIETDNQMPPLAQESIEEVSISYQNQPLEHDNQRSVASVLNLENSDVNICDRETDTLFKKDQCKNGNPKEKYKKVDEPKAKEADIETPSTIDKCENDDPKEKYNEVDELKAKEADIETPSTLDKCENDDQQEKYNEVDEPKAKEADIETPSTLDKCENDDQQEKYNEVDEPKAKEADIETPSTLDKCENDDQQEKYNEVDEPKAKEADIETPSTLDKCENNDPKEKYNEVDEPKTMEDDIDSLSTQDKCENSDKNEQGDKIMKAKTNEDELIVQSCDTANWLQPEGPNRDVSDTSDVIVLSTTDKEKAVMEIQSPGKLSEIKSEANKMKNKTTNYETEKILAVINSLGQTSRHENSVNDHINDVSTIASEQITNVQPEQSELILLNGRSMDPAVAETSNLAEDGDHDSGVDESTQGKENPEESPKKPTPKTSSKLPRSTPSHVTKVTSPSSGTASPARTKEAVAKSSSGTGAQDKKLPMNKIVVGTSPSPNLKVVHSKIGSLENVKHRAGGGNVKLETKKIDLTTVKSKIGSTDNIQHKAAGGEKKVLSRKLEWKAQSKVGSLDNATHKAGGGTKKIETQKLDFKDKAKPKVGSRDNIQHKPGGGDVKIEEHKLDIVAQSKIGSLDYASHKPGGGNVQIFDEKLYYKQQQQKEETSKKSSLTGSDGHISDNQNSALSSLQETPSPLANTDVDISKDPSKELDQSVEAATELPPAPSTNDISLSLAENTSTSDTDTQATSVTSDKIVTSSAGDAGSSPKPTELSTKVVGSPTKAGKSLTKGKGSPTKGAGSPTKGAGSPTKGAGSPTKGAGSPTKGAGSPTKGAGSPTKGAGSPTKGAGSPTKGAGSPTKSTGSPTKVAGSPTKGAGSPAKASNVQSVKPT